MPLLRTLMNTREHAQAGSQPLSMGGRSTTSKEEEATPAMASLHQSRVRQISDARVASTGVALFLVAVTHLGRPTWSRVA